MESTTSRSGWKSRTLPLLPPALLHAYRKMRYGSLYTGPGNADGALSAHRPEVEFSLPSRTLGELFPGIDAAEATVPAKEIMRPPDMVVPLAELLTLAAICKHLRPRRIFEVGTYTGSSTLVMAMNAPEGAEVLTLDLEPSEIVGSAYRDTPYQSKIRQLYGDSLVYDFTPFHGSADMILIDANHAYDFVKADTETAFKLLRPGGVIVWDDYRWLDCHAECAGVTLYLNDLHKSRPLSQIAGTRFAIYLDGVSERDETA